MKIANCKLQIENCKFEISDFKSAESHAARSADNASHPQFAICNSSRRCRGFTLVELLVVITIIAILAAISLAALARTREAAKLEATKATVTKLHSLVMQRFLSYQTRRVPLNLAGTNPTAASATRMQAIRDLMRMEMPERWSDITTGPLVSDLKQPGAAADALPGEDRRGAAPPNHQQAKCLYLWVMTAFPEAKSIFKPEEIADVDGDGYRSFVDGWGSPIGFLRWAPARPAGPISRSTTRQPPTCITTRSTRCSFKMDRARMRPTILAIRMRPIIYTRSSSRTR